MSKAVKTVFGGTDDSAQEAQQDANAATQRFIEEQSKLAREDAMSLFPEAERNILAGSQGALDIMGQTIPQQIAALQQGNQNAQNAILGLGQTNFTPDMSFAQQILPSLRAPENRFGAASNLAGSPVNNAAIAADQAGPDLSQYATNRDLIEAGARGDISGLSGQTTNFLNRWLADANKKIAQGDERVRKQFDVDRYYMTDSLENRERNAFKGGSNAGRNAQLELIRASRGLNPSGDNKKSTASYFLGGV